MELEKSKQVRGHVMATGGGQESCIIGGHMEGVQEVRGSYVKEVEVTRGKQGVIWRGCRKSGGHVKEVGVTRGKQGVIWREAEGHHRKQCMSEHRRWPPAPVQNSSAAVLVQHSLVQHSSSAVLVWHSLVQHSSAAVLVWHSLVQHSSAAVL